METQQSHPPSWRIEEELSCSGIAWPWAGPPGGGQGQQVQMLVFSKVSIPFGESSALPLKINSLLWQFVGARTLGAPGPSLVISFSAFASFLWYTHRTPCLMLPASLIHIDRSCAVLGAAGSSEPPKKATQPERSTGRCRSTATGSVTSAFFFSQMLGLGSAETNSPELPSRSTALSVLAVVLVVAGLVVFGEA